MRIDPTQRRLRIFLVLATTALVAFFVASGVTRLVGRALLPLVPRSPTGAHTALLEGTDRTARDPSAILERHMFDSTREPPVVIGDTPPRRPAEPGAPLSACIGALRLVGAFYSSQRPGRSFAAISNPAGEVLVYRAGMSVDGRTIDAIRVDSVELSTPDTRCSLTLFTQPLAPAPALAAITGIQAPLSGELPGGISQAELDAGITRVSDTEYRVQRGLVARILENQALALHSAHAVLHQEEGRVVGVNLYGISRASMLGRLGMQSGDMLRTINGFALTSPDEALAAYARLRDADHLTVSIMRHGQPTNLDFRIE